MYTDYSTTIRIEKLFHWRCAEVYRSLETVSTAYITYILRNIYSCLMNMLGCTKTPKILSDTVYMVASM